MCNSLNLSCFLTATESVKVQLKTNSIPQADAGYPPCFSQSAGIGCFIKHKMCCQRQLSRTDCFIMSFAQVIFHAFTSVNPAELITCYWSVCVYEVHWIWSTATAWRMMKWIDCASLAKAQLVGTSLHCMTMYVVVTSCSVLTDKGGRIRGSLIKLNILGTKVTTRSSRLVSEHLPNLQELQWGSTVQLPSRRWNVSKRRKASPIVE